MANPKRKGLAGFS